MSMQVRLHCFEAVHAGAHRRQSPHQHDMQTPVKVQHAMLLRAVTDYSDLHRFDNI